MSTSNPHTLSKAHLAEIGGHLMHNRNMHRTLNPGQPEPAWLRQRWAEYVRHTSDIAPSDIRAFTTAVRSHAQQIAQGETNRQIADLVIKREVDGRKGTEDVMGLPGGLKTSEQAKLLRQGAGFKTKVPTNRTWVGPTKQVDEWTKKEFGGLTRKQLDKLTDLKTAHYYTDHDRYREEVRKVAPKLDEDQTDAITTRWGEQGFKLAYAEHLAKKEDKVGTPYEREVVATDEDHRRMATVKAFDKEAPGYRNHTDDAKPQYEDDRRAALSASWDLIEEEGAEATDVIDALRSSRGDDSTSDVQGGDDVR